MARMQAGQWQSTSKQAQIPSSNSTYSRAMKSKAGLSAKFLMRQNLLMALFSLIGTVLTKVIIFTPCASSMLTALVLGSMALASTGTDGTDVHSHILFMGLL
eukprot:GHUV01056818.1.p2 GENE.GHUV01056818.1~~GHUV01056818.1.p2  ORF type:complete len:102 (+),score=16.32 GHUV01056818.1:879-1184(+)